MRTDFIYEVPRTGRPIQDHSTTRLMPKDKAELMPLHGESLCRTSGNGSVQKLVQENAGRKRALGSWHA